MVTGQQGRRLRGAAVDGSPSPLNLRWVTALAYVPQYSEIYMYTGKVGLYFNDNMTICVCSEKSKFRSKNGHSEIWLQKYLHTLVGLILFFTPSPNPWSSLRMPAYK